MQTFVDFSKYNGLEQSHEIRNYADKIKTQYLALMDLAEFEVLDHWDLVDPYAGRPYMPWMLIKTKYGLIKMGWRKRVLSINWKDTGLEIKDLTKDEVTKENFLVHAWTIPKALEYLMELKQRMHDTIERDKG